MSRINPLWDWTNPEPPEPTVERWRIVDAKGYHLRYEDLPIGEVPEGVTPR